VQNQLQNDAKSGGLEKIITTSHSARYGLSESRFVLARYGVSGEPGQRLTVLAILEHS
jgi:hypothetical protein